MKRLVVFTGNLSFSVRKGIAELLTALDDIEVLIVHQTPRKPISKLIRNQRINLKKNGWRWIPYQTEDIIKRILQRFSIEPNTAAEAPGLAYETETLLHTPGVQHLPCTNMHDEEILQKITLFAPDLGISLAAPILKEPLFSIPVHGTINLHKGKAPDYRGMPPAFWELWNGEKEVGCTIHKVEAGLDTGAVLLQSVIPVQEYSTVKGLQLCLDELGVAMMIDAVRSIFDGSAKWQKQAAGGTTYRKPTLKQIAQLNRRLNYARNSNRLKKSIKDSIFFCYAHLYRPLPKRLLATQHNQRIIVILYHRVSDQFRDSVTVGIEQFDRQMELLGKVCTVVSIDDIVEGNLPYASKRPIVAVTFDDGYLDNYEIAAPILVKHRVPAAFFVSTGIVGSENGFAHDLKNLGYALPNMSWPQIAQMKQWGFTIGSHTVSHINCAQDDPDKVRAEITQSKKTLEEKLGIEHVIFAYPFGKRTDFNEEMLEYVKTQGFVGCLSAYGGRNSKSLDKYNVLRGGIDHSFTELAFRARLEGMIN
jgi:peptidoglycan/xylan/chitin deacetylase (PgdA/CDA1 family)/folate-dependent phosphoribosylglycinamide formyltransferase PurN